MASIMYCVHYVSFSIHGAGFIGEAFEWNYHTVYSVRTVTKMNSMYVRMYVCT